MSSLILPRRDLIVPRRFRQRGFIINPYAFGGAAGNGYLDGLGTSPRSVVWLGKKYSTATQCLRLRRASDNAETDIGFSGDLVNVAAAESHCGASDGFVVTGYDQSGNSEHWTFPGGSATQPKVVSSGTWLGEMQFDGSNDYGMISSLTMGTDYAAIFTRVKKASMSATEIMFELSTNYNSQSGTAIVVYAESGRIRSGSSNTNGYDVDLSAGKLVSFVYDRTLSSAAETKCWFDSVSQDPADDPGQSSTTGTFGTFDFYIAARAGSSLHSDQQLQGAIIYNADVSSIRAGIEALL